MNNWTFGNTQYYMSRRMQAFPALGKLVHKVFGYTNVGNYARALTFQGLIEQLPLEQPKRVMDLGCGQGEYTFMMAQALPNTRITALDIEPERIHKINQLANSIPYPNVETHCGKVEEMPKQEEGYDLVFSVDVFEHIPEKEMPFSAAYRQLKEGGFLLVKMPSRQQQTILPDAWFEEHEHWLEEEHIGQVYELEDLKERMQEEGFEISYAAYADGWLARLGWELGYLSKKAGAVVQLAVLPLAKLLVRLDRLIPARFLKKGNTIQVIGKKV
jgi:SAM-dependent methyltransferase